MTSEEQTVLVIKGVIEELPVAQRVATKELVELMRRQIEAAGEVVGNLALALVGAETQLKNSR